MLKKKRFNIKIADLVIEINAREEFSQRKCASYVNEAINAPDIIAEASQKDIETEKKGNGSFTDSYCEFVCLYRSIAEQLPFFDGMVFHGAAVETAGRAYIFTAPSGTGKSTHLKLWMDCFGDRVEVINGDKPILRKNGEDFFVYSSPWAGKEGWHSNICAPLDAICLIRRGKENKIRDISPSEYFDEIMGQIYVPKNSEAWLKTLSLIDELANKTRFFLLECNISEEAARLSYETLTK